MVPVKIILPTNKLSGGTIQVIELAINLRKIGIPTEVSCIFRHFENYIKEERLSFITKYTLPSGRLKFPFLIYAYLRYLVEIRKYKGILIFTHFYTYPILRKNNNYLLYIQGQEDSFIKNKIFKLIIQSFIKNFALNSKQNLLVSRVLSNRYKNETYLPNILTDLKISKSGNKDLNLLFCFSQSHVKNPSFYMEVWDILCRNRQLNVGVVELSSFPHSGKSLKKFPPQSQIEFQKLLSRSDYFLVASLSEGFGLTVIEALRGGAIVFVTEFGGIGEELIQELPYCKVSDPVELVEKITFLEANPTVKKELQHSCLVFLVKSENQRKAARLQSLREIESLIKELNCGQNF